MTNNSSESRRQVGLVSRPDVTFDMVNAWRQEVSHHASLTLDNCEDYPWPDWTGTPDAKALEDYHRAVDMANARHWVPVQAVEGLLRGVRLVLTHHSFPSCLLETFSEQVREYLRCDDEITFVGRAKHFLCAPMARYLRNEAPPSPGVVFTWTGGIRRWFRSRMKFCAKNTHLWWSFYQAKRACAPISEDYVRYTYEKHRRQMAAPDPIDDETLEVVMTQLSPVLAMLRQDVGYAMQSCIDVDGEDVPVPAGTNAHVASQSACYEATVKAGGQKGHLARVAFGDVIPTGWQLRSMRFFPRVVINGEFRFNHVASFYESTEVDRFLFGVVGDESRVYEQRGGSQGERVRLPCMIQAVVEPLKARIISKGPAAPYYLAKTFQKALHTRMRRMDCFRLIGRPMSPTDLLDLDANSVRLRMFEGRMWFSIDYSAATDGLSARLSAAILDSLFPDGMDEKEKQRLRNVLAPHRCEYPPRAGLEPVDEVNGQLMGSILSFPILCLANLGLFLAVIRHDSRNLRDKLSGVLVNGDDMLYVAAPSLYPEHSALGKKCGLELSVGKSYVHPTFASANSTCFHAPLSQTPRFNGPTRVRDVRQVNFLNTGLFFGNSKVMRVDSIDGSDASDCGRLAVLGALLSGCWSAHQELSLSKMYFSLHRDEIIRQAAGRNYFIHSSLGGCGAVVPTGWKWTTDARQRAIAFQRAERLSLSWGRSHVEVKVFGPRTSPEVEDLFSHATQPWEEPIVLEHDEHARWPRVVGADGQRTRLIVPSSRCFSKTQLISGVCRTRLGRDF